MSHSLGTDTPLPLQPMRPGGPILIYALSGMGKSTLASEHPDKVFDTDLFLYKAVEIGFPELDARARLRAWRELCRSHPWTNQGADLELWVTVRRAFITPFITTMRDGSHKLVVTSLIEPPWNVSAYYGIQLGQYLEHLHISGRPADNRHSEAMNYRLEGYTPLRRLAPGTFLSQRPEIQALLKEEIRSP